MKGLRNNNNIRRVIAKTSFNQTNHYPIIHNINKRNIQSPLKPAHNFEQNILRCVHTNQHHRHDHIR